MPIPSLDLDAPDDLAAYLDDMVRVLSARWLLDPADAATIVRGWIEGEDLHGSSGINMWYKTKDTAGHLYHRHVVHDQSYDDDELTSSDCSGECRDESRQVLELGPIAAGFDGVLLLAAQPTSTARLLAEAAERRGFEVRYLTGPGDLDGLAGRQVYWYGGPLAAERAVSALRIGLLEPEDGFLSYLDRRLAGRRIESATLSQAWELTAPAFVKPPSDKSFPAAVYSDGAGVPRVRVSSDGGEPGDDVLAPDTPVLISQVVNLVAEYRLFLLDDQIAAASRYAVHGRLDPAPLEGDPREREVRAFARTVISFERFYLPSAVVVDVGLARDPATGRERWVVVEANMAWFANCYAADPDRVLDVVLRSAGPLAHVDVLDFAFLREWAV